MNRMIMSGKIDRACPPKRSIEEAADRAVASVSARIMTALRTGRDPDPHDIRAAVDLALVGRSLGGVS